MMILLVFVIFVHLSCPAEADEMKVKAALQDIERNWNQSHPAALNKLFSNDVTFYIDDVAKPQDKSILIKLLQAYPVIHIDVEKIKPLQKKKVYFGTALVMMCNRDYKEVLSNHARFIFIAEIIKGKVQFTDFAYNCVNPISQNVNHPLVIKRDQLP